MGYPTGLGCVTLALLLMVGPVSAQTLSNQSLSGKFFFRHVSLGTDGSGNLTDPRSLIGTITFDGVLGNGHYSYIGQQVIGNGSATSQTGSGSYSVDPAGFVSLDSPLRSGAKVNARLGSSMLLGSTTESADSTYDLFAAILAPTGSVGNTLAGPFWGVTLEFPGGTRGNARDTFFNLSSTVAGQFAAISVNGHAANLSSGLPTTQQVAGATYTMGADGTGTATFGTASTAALLSGARTLYVSADGNTLLGGSTAAGSHDFFIAVKAAAGANNGGWNADFWATGLRSDASGALGYTGAVSARGLGNLTWTRRYKQLGSGAYDFTGLETYSLISNGSGTILAAGAGLGSVALGSNGKNFVGAIVNANDTGGYEIFFGAQMNSLSGTGVFLNPQRVLNAASYAPAGNPISPGEYVSLFGSGMAAAAVTAKSPYPPTLGGVTVLVNGKQAPLYYVSATQINALVPYATQGPTATIVVQNGTASSNTVTVPVANTSPGFFASDQSGTGIAAVLHGDANRGLVTPDNPASPGETVVVFLSGMGAVNPAIADGTATGTNPLSKIAASPIAMYIAGQIADTSAYTGLAPGYPGLYQINVVVPLAIFSSGNVPMAISTPNAFHDQVSLPVQ
jgi:uncharacterized protein (TIGR03437 family)